MQYKGFVVPIALFSLAANSPAQQAAPRETPKIAVIGAIARHE